ncbi:MAG TPA: xanthine phosphoribosyltransferase [Anaerolineae bacterium]|nr:xanthine phosphoribosyltransferase [Anaerolineae bacterium]MCB0176685.1 xanthine phosphoribosyltransferase [Anaerolineae bacterium]MCB0226018.1 xanthine phosphoribosyltransferase [Anaerolineae bacterium]MCB9104673.1 xanthine phosphoribosyltransferase [Anaerolineales bacterium]HRV91855.1 xanthine phosphoribosyltransferase [Anaerolineae bacterium]
MKALKERIQKEGKNLGNGILKVDSFLNHQVDPALMLAVGGALAAHFGAMGITKVLTAEISGIAPALTTALALGVPVVYGRKTKPITMPEDIYVEAAPSHTKGKEVYLMVSPEFLGPDDSVLIIDDFLATGHTIMALVRLARKAGAKVVGVGAVIEKSFEGGRAQLEAMDLQVRSLAVIKQMTDKEIIFAEGVSP